MHLDVQEDRKVTDIGVEKRGKKSEGTRLCFGHRMALIPFCVTELALPVVTAAVGVGSLGFTS